MANLRAVLIAQQLVTERRRIVEELTPLVSEPDKPWAKMKAHKMIYDMVLPFCAEPFDFRSDDIQERVSKLEPHPLFPGGGG